MIAKQALAYCLILTVCGASWAKPAAAVDRGTFILIHDEALKPAAEEWAAYRAADGWRVTTHGVAALSDASEARTQIQQLIRSDYAAVATSPHSGFAVLLLGDVDAIPAWEFPQRDPQLRSSKDENYATDHPYQLMDDNNDQADVALGRVPARTVDEARAVLAKIKAYESQSLPGPWRTRITYAAGEGRFGPIDNMLESLFKTMVDRMVPEAFDISMTYAKASSVYCPPPSKLTETVLERLGEGAILFNYIGHGFARGFDSLRWNGKRYPILRTNDLTRLNSDPIQNPNSKIQNGHPPQRPIAFFSCCSVGWYDLPAGEPSLAEAMLLHPAGPVAIIAGSRITHPYANTVLQKDITRALLVDRAATVGDLDLMAMRSLVEVDEDDKEIDALTAPIALAGRWKTSLKGLRGMHVRLYNLFGDPATRIALPANAIDSLAYENSAITGRIEGMKTGRVWITAETSRVSMAAPGNLMQLDGDDDPELEHKAANNYPLVNDRVLARFEGEVIDGRFRIDVNGDLPPAAAVLRGYAHGADAANRPMDAVGAVRLHEMTTRPVATNGDP